MRRIAIFEKRTDNLMTGNKHEDVEISDLDENECDAKGSNRQRDA